MAFLQDLQSLSFFLSLDCLYFISHAEITCLLTFHWSRTYTIFLRLLPLSWQLVLTSSHMLGKRLTCLSPTDSLTFYIHTLSPFIARVGYFWIILIFEVLIHQGHAFGAHGCPLGLPIHPPIHPANGHPWAPNVGPCSTPICLLHTLPMTSISLSQVDSILVSRPSTTQWYKSSSHSIAYFNYLNHDIHRHYVWADICSSLPSSNFFQLGMSSKRTFLH